MISRDDVLLAFDAGNTRIKWGVHDGHGWSALGAADTANAAGLYESIRGALPVDAAIACNVAGDAVRSELERACARAQVPLTVIASCAEQLGVTNGYADPSQLGPDRWAALVAAHHAGGGHKLVVNAGTALTVDALDAGGRFVGGLIVPGPALMRASLNRGTAGLRLTEGAFADFPRSTPDAITSGAMQACLGAIERLAAAMAARGSPVERIVLSGGAAREIAAGLRLGYDFRENLVLDGLALIARGS
jgi:type III pantothenate kinase